MVACSYSFKSNGEEYLGQALTDHPLFSLGDDWEMSGQ